jgi:hypothetical protein
MKKYRLLLLSFVFLGTLLGSFHYHNDLVVDDDCPVCIVQNNFDSSADVILLPLDTSKIAYDNNILNNNTDYTFIKILNTLSRAPPKYS